MPKIFFLVISIFPSPLVGLLRPLRAAIQPWLQSVYKRGRAGLETISRAVCPWGWAT